MPDYAHPEALVSADWVAQHLNDPKVRIVETDEDPALYFMGHIPGAVEIGWHNQLQDPVTRDYISQAAFEELCSNAGITPETTVVFYGDKSNWWACYAFWAFKLFGHKDCRIMNGGYKLWKDQGRPMQKDVPAYTRTSYKAQPIEETSIRAFREDVLAHTALASPCWTCAVPVSTPANSSTCPTIPRKAPSAAVTSRERRTSPGARRSTTMAPSSPPKSFERSTLRD